MPRWKESLANFWETIKPHTFGAGFIRGGVDLAGHPHLVTFDGVSAYFFGLTEREAARFLSGVTMLSGYTGWLAYMLQELFFDEAVGDDLYDEIFDGLHAGVIKGPAELSGEAIYRWVEDVAPGVEILLFRLSGSGAL
ncbi:MAG: hypothetical protein M1130_03360 [Actinobacteria bacterium]|nr:hypothetical protein [Actinomycetota bacterium]